MFNPDPHQNELDPKHCKALSDQDEWDIHVFVYLNRLFYLGIFFKCELLTSETMDKLTAFITF